MYARYMHNAYQIKKLVDFVTRKTPSAELEEISALAYYYYIKVQCDVNNIQLTFLDTDFPALKKKIIKPLRRFKLVKKADRSMAKAL